jgi:hypothetical protein
VLTAEIFAASISAMKARISVADIAHRHQEVQKGD